MWSIFRVENEHCTNVHRFRASRDIPLPYALSTPTDAVSMYEETYDPSSQQDPILEGPETGTATGTDVDLERVATSDTVRRRRQQQQQPPQMVRGMSRVGAIMATAHAQDFERKKKPDALSGDSKDIDETEIRTEDSTDYEDEEEDEEGVGDDASDEFKDASGEDENNESKTVAN